MTKKQKKELKAFKDVIKIIEKGYGTKVCSSYSPGCSNCEAQILLGHLYWEVSMIELENDQARKKDKAVASGSKKTKKTIRPKRDKVL